MVITMIFLMATSLLVVRNWQLVAELRESVEAEQVAVQEVRGRDPRLFAALPRSWAFNAGASQGYRWRSRRAACYRHA
mgnify:CR=1 FL=1